MSCPVVPLTGPILLTTKPLTETNGSLVAGI